MATLVLVQTPDPANTVRQHLPSGAVVDPPLFTITGDVIFIGRDGVEIEILDPLVSRVHARIAHQAGAYFVEDLRTRNHTRVNGQTLGTAQQMLADGDQIDVVGYIFEFQSTGGSRVSAVREDKSQKGTFNDCPPDREAAYTVVPARRLAARVNHTTDG
jgi:pSer/pThr/pTyr-binding forkhead associated (FHA) protein